MKHFKSKFIVKAQFNNAQLIGALHLIRGVWMRVTERFDMGNKTKYKQGKPKHGYKLVSI